MEPEGVRYQAPRIRDLIQILIADAAEWPVFPAIGVVPQEPRFCL